MSNSLSDQLLKAGLITQDQVEKADQDKQKQKEKARARFNKKPDNQGQPAKGKAKPEPQKNTKKPGKAKQPSDLAKFYQQRNQVEQAERTAEEKRKREAAERRRKTRKQIRQLIEEHAQNAEDASVRYNFVVGETVKYLFVTETQQDLIAKGELSITFMDGKRCLIPVAIGEEILALDPEKVVVRFSEDDTNNVDDFPVMPEEVETVATDSRLPDSGNHSAEDDQQETTQPSTGKTATKTSEEQACT